MSGRQDGERGFLTWAEVVRRLGERNIRVRKATLQHYIKLGLLPKPQARGRPGKGKGVDWGWPEFEAGELAERVRQIRRRLLDRRETLAQIVEEETREAVEGAVRKEVKDEVWQEAYDQGYQDAIREMAERPADEDGGPVAR